MAIRKRTNNDVQHITKKTRETRTTKKKEKKIYTMSYISCTRTSCDMIVQCNSNSMDILSYGYCENTG